MCPAGRHGLDYQGQSCDLCPRRDAALRAHGVTMASVEAMVFARDLMTTSLADAVPSHPTLRALDEAILSLRRTCALIHETLRRIP